jgi:hypothetical protein
MHYCVFVMIPFTEDIEMAIKQALQPFEENHRVKPYRVYLRFDEIKQMAEFYKLSPADTHRLAERMQDWLFRPGGVDRRGLYYLDDFNSDGYWDWYQIGGRWKGCIPEAADDVIPAKELTKNRLRHCLPSYVLTPEGKWLERERFYVLSNGASSVMTLGKKVWMDRIQEVLATWPDHLVVCVDIHQ